MAITWNTPQPNTGIKWNNTPSAPTPAPQQSLADKIWSGLGTLTRPLQEGISGLGTLYGGGEQGIANKLVSNVQAGAQDIEQGNVLKGIAKSGLRSAGDIAGTVYAPIGAVIGATGIGKLTDIIGKSIADSRLGNMITDMPAVQDFAIKHPNAAEDFGRALNLIFAAKDTGKIEPSTALQRTKTQISNIPSKINALRPTAESIATERQAKLNKGFEEQNVRLKTAGNSYNDNTIVRTDPEGNHTVITPIDTFSKNNIAPVIEKGSIQMGDYRLGIGELGKIKEKVKTFDDTIDTKLVNTGQQLDLETLKQEAISKAENDSNFRRSGTVATNVKKIETRFEDYGNSYGDSMDITELNHIRKLMNKDWNVETMDSSRIIGDVARDNVYREGGKEVQDLLHQQGELLAAKKYAETINGTKVVGGRLGNMALRTTGAIIGSTLPKLPIIGPVLGAIGGEYASRALQQTQFKSAWTELKALLQSNSLEQSQSATTIPKSGNISPALPRSGIISKGTEFYPPKYKKGKPITAKEFEKMNAEYKNAGKAEVRGNRQIEDAMYKEAIANHPARQLAKYANANGELPEVLGGVHNGKGAKSKFGTSGDSMATEAGFSSSEEARESYAHYRELVEKYKEFKKKGLLDKGYQSVKPTQYLNRVEAEAEIFRNAKGLSAQDIMSKHPDIQLKRDIPVTDVYGKKSVIPKGEALTPYELRGNKVMLKDGETYIVSKNQFQNIKGNAISGGAKEFAPELKGATETVLKTGGETNGEASFRIYGKKWTELSDAQKEKVATYMRKEDIAPTKFSQYQLPGGKNYKEVLIKAPSRENSPYNLTVNKTGQVYKQFPNYKEAFDYYKSLSSEERALGKIEPTTATSDFKSSHWDEPNVISHLRLNERIYQGKKVTFMEEMQSDWAREGRSKGFVRDRTPAEIATEKALVDKGVQSLATRKIGEIPNNPLLKNWQELSVKRALKEAVDNKSEYLAWTTGEQQAARYNLAKDVDFVKWKSSDVGENRLVSIKPKEGSTIEVQIDKNGTVYKGGESSWMGKKITDVIPKGIGDKIMETPTGNLSGEGLNIGGEWAKNLYDKQVKNIVEDVTGHKVEVIDMGLPVDNKVPAFDLIQPSGKRIAKLTPDNLEVRALVSNAKGDYYIITDILGDGKFKAVPSKVISEMKQGLTTPATTEELVNPKLYAERLAKKNHLDVEDSWIKQMVKHRTDALNNSSETFDISTKKSAGQQAIKITPEIRALVKGENPLLKKPSGTLP